MNNNQLKNFFPISSQTSYSDKLVLLKIKCRYFLSSYKNHQSENKIIMNKILTEIED